MYKTTQTHRLKLYKMNEIRLLIHDEKDLYDQFDPEKTGKEVFGFYSKGKQRLKRYDT